MIEKANPSLKLLKEASDREKTLVVLLLLVEEAD